MSDASAATIADLAANPERLNLKSPAILIFGEVAGLPAHGTGRGYSRFRGARACLCLTSSPPIASPTASSSISPRTAAGLRSFARARIASTEDEIKALEDEAAKEVKARKVVAVYAMDVALHDGAVDPLSVRERIRASHRTTLTKDWYDVPL